MPLQPHMKLLSVDDHLIEHPKVWTDRLPSKYLDAGPRIVEIPRGDGSAADAVLAVRGSSLSVHRAQCGRRQEAAGVRPGTGPLRRHDPWLL